MRKQRSITSGKHQGDTGRPAAQRDIQEILTTTDFSDESRSGVRYAVALAEKLGTVLTLLHVIEPPSRLSVVESVLAARNHAEAVALTREQLAALVKSVVKSDLAVTLSVRTGKAFNEISAAAGESAADLIVIATHGYTGIARALLGSTAERVVRHAPCSVLTVPARVSPKRAGKAPTLRLKRILVPMDFSELSKNALPQAIFLAEQFKAEVVLLHVVEKFPIDYFMGRELTSQTIVSVMKQAKADLTLAAADLAKSIGVKISAAIREGKPHEKICESAKSLAVDLIVLTTHGYTGLKHAWLGSTAERVVRHASCPVLVVRAMEFSAAKPIFKTKPTKKTNT